MLNPDRINTSLKQLGWPLFLVFFFLFFFRPIEIEDIWWHLSTGRWILANGAFPTQDVFSYVSPPGHWILTQAPASCIFYIVYLLDGLFALKIFRVIIIGAAIACADTPNFSSIILTRSDASSKVNSAI